MDIVTRIADLRRHGRSWRAGGQTLALVPTMGALHAGHVSLVEAARALADRVVVSIFVNPRQFGPREDLSRYPRRETEDAAMLRTAGADLLFLPEVAEVYPPGFVTEVRLPGIADQLCGAARPGHFDGVATVVTKLLNMAQADVAVFGEKDYQQLLIIRTLARDLNIDTRIHGAPLVRDADGLALSSRNAYLSGEERRIALHLPRLLHESRERLLAGEAVDAVLEAVRAELLSAGFASVDYVALCNAETLAPLHQLDAPARLLAAAHVGTTRLIDNLAV